jgi:5'-nucleotidase/UDP-sugar diphosphatase
VRVQIFAVVWLIAALACGETPASAPTGPLSLVVLHSADTHAQLFPYARVLSARDEQRGLGSAETLTEVGGFARLATRVREERRRAARVLHVDSGDVFQGSLSFLRHQGEPELKVLSALGVDAQALGNHELDGGAAPFRERYREFAQFPLLAANYEVDGAGDADAPAPFTVVAAGDVLVGVIGVGNVASVPELRERPNELALSSVESERAVQAYLDFLRPLVDVVIAVTHLGLSGDEALVRGTTGLDAVFGGHQHVVLDAPRFVDDCTGGRVTDAWGFSRGCSPRRVPIVHSGAYTEYLGRLALTLDDRPFALPASYDPIDRYEVTEALYEPLPLSRDVVEDEAISALIAPYANRERDPGLGATAFAPAAVARAAANGGDSPLGNLAARAARVFAEADVALLPSSGLRRDLPPGLLDDETLFRSLPFDDPVVRMRVTGAELLAALDMAAKLASSRGCETPIHVDGIRVALRCSCEARPCATTSAVAPDGAYELATTAYLARGAHGLFRPRNEHEWIEVAPNLARSVAEHLRHGAPCHEQVDATCGAGCSSAWVARAAERCASGTLHPACASLEEACAFARVTCAELACAGAAVGAAEDGRVVVGPASP